MLLNNIPKITKSFSGSEQFSSNSKIVQWIKENNPWFYVSKECSRVSLNTVLEYIEFLKDAYIIGD